MTKKILVVAAHPDDEVLGCGGTVARHSAAGDDVTVVFMTDGVGSRQQRDNDSSSMRKAAAQNAHRILGVKETIQFDYMDNQLDRYPLLELVQSLENVVTRIAPEVVYTHHCGDLNVDHRLTNQIVLTALRPVPHSSVREIYTFEVISSTEWNPMLLPFQPQLFVDVSKHMHKKLEALEAYAIEMRPTPHSRSVSHVSALAVHRGHTIGRNNAEAFMIARLIR
jgi:LmbE family N-acetylglucosaminyl deacetylase